MRDEGYSLEEIGKVFDKKASTICRWFKKPSLWNPGLFGDVG